MLLFVYVRFYFSQMFELTVRIFSNWLFVDIRVKLFFIFVCCWTFPFHMSSVTHVFKVRVFRSLAIVLFTISSWAALCYSMYNKSWKWINQRKRILNQCWLLRSRVCFGIGLRLEGARWDKSTPYSDCVTVSSGFTNVMFIDMLVSGIDLATPNTRSQKNG